MNMARSGSFGKRRFNFIVCISLFIFRISNGISQMQTSKGKLPVVFVYTVVPAVCKHGLPSYIKESLLQALFSQNDAIVALASNFAECSLIEKNLLDMPNLLRIDTTTISSNRTKEFANRSTSIFSSDYGGELWITSALRFFIMDDIMKSYEYTEMMHVEADNMLYGRLSDILPVLRTSYKGLAATPLTASINFITASVFWISDKIFLRKFTDYLLAIARNSDNMWKKYVYWLRFRGGCCKQGGVDPDQNGNGVKPFAINEMSMLAYYYDIDDQLLKLLPVVPKFDKYVKGRNIVDLPSFAPGGSKTGKDTGAAIWDANSWGQYIGGTSKKKGRDKGFTDPSHISGQAIRTSGCSVRMECGMHRVKPSTQGISPQDIVILNGTTDNITQSVCFTQPIVRCNNSQGTPLWNLHVHSKHTINYRSQPCQCA